ncbi:MAG: M67 family metallopeptidase [Candidatus Nitrosocaldaceae archaeon]
MIKKLELYCKHIDELQRITKNALPLESCALLVGNIRYDIAKVEYIIELKNIANSYAMFMFDEKEFYELYMKVRKDKRDIIAIFHSHPSKPEPSSMDLKYMILNQIPWIIMSNIDYKFYAYAYYDKLEMVEIVILDTC